MASRSTFHSQLSSIMETMANSVLSQVCKLVDEDSVEIRLELSRLLAANSNLADKIKSLESELTAVRSDPPKLSERNRSVGVQTACSKDDACGTSHNNNNTSDLNRNYLHYFCVYQCVLPVFAFIVWLFPKCLDLPP